MVDFVLDEFFFEYKIIVSMIARVETLIIEIPNPKDKEVILLLAGKLHCKIIEPRKKSDSTISSKKILLKHLSI